MIAKIGAAHNASLVSSADIRVLPADSFGGADRVRTDDPLLAKQVLSQLSYSPELRTQSKGLRTEWVSRGWLLRLVRLPTLPHTHKAQWSTSSRNTQSSVLSPQS